MHARVAIFILGFAAMSVGARAQSLTVTTFAGDFWTSGSADGTGRAARFNFPQAAAVDPAGNLYINDTNNNTVRRVSAAGVVTTLAGSPGAKAYVDGVGAAARFFQPRGLVRDTAGNLYLTDLDLARGAGVVRKITPAGVVSTFVTSVSGSSLAIDAFNTLLVGGGSEVRTFAANGSEIFRDWPANLPTPGGVPRPPAGNFGNIWWMALDRIGNLFIADITARQIRKVTPTRVMTVLAGGGDPGYADGFGTNARFNMPNSIVVDSQGNIYVGDANNAVLRRISPAGEVTTVLGIAGAPPIFGSDGRVSFPDGTGSAARLSGPQGLAIGPDDTIYILDLHAIRKAVVVTTAAKVVTPPSSLILAAGERATFTVAANGNPAVTFQWQRLPASSAAWIDLADNAVYSGTRTAALTVNAVTAAMSGDRYRVAVRNSLGSDTSLPAQLVVDPPVVVVPLRVSTLAGLAGSGIGPVDGAGSAARFFGPQVVACDANGNLYVSEISGNAIRKITPGGVATTLAGGGPAGWVDGIGRGARFQQPGSIAVDRTGNVFVLDRSISMDEAVAPVVRKITPAGVVTTFLTAVPGGLPMRNITSLAIDRAGNLLLFGFPGVYFRFTPAGAGTAVPIPPSPATGVVTRLVAAAIDAADTLYFTTIDHTVLKLTPSGPLTLVAGRSGTPGAVDGRPGIALFRSPAAIAVDGTGSLYVADTGNHVIRRIDPAGNVSTVAGIKPTIAATRPTGWSDGIGPAVRFNHPTGITVDRAGVLYLADNNNHVIRRGVRLDVVAAGERAELFVQTAGELPPEQASAAAPAGRANAPSRAAATLTDRSHQWFKDGVAVAGATATTLIIEAARPSDAGNYTLQETSAGVTQMSAPVALSVRGSRLANLSIRSTAGTGTQTLTVGFVVENAGLPLLVRAIGPGLQPFGVTGMVPRPRLTLHEGALALAESLGGANDVDIVDASTRAGAFVLPPESRDAALLTQLESGAFTVQCTDAGGGSGVALVELYDTSLDRASRSRLINVSARSQVGVDDGVMIAGIAVSGTSPCRVLIRGIGPALTQFGVNGALADPALSVFDHERRLRAQNDDWSSAGNAGEIAAGMQRVGAFSLANGSKDAALVLSLEPGAYTVQLSGIGRTTGVGLIEVYELP